MRARTEEMRDCGQKDRTWVVEVVDNGKFVTLLLLNLEVV